MVEPLSKHTEMPVYRAEESAKIDDMPKSAINAGLTDHVLPPATMSHRILAFVKHLYASKAELSECPTE
jgi:chemotaxis response regulator CheB